jgi:3-oxoacyl-[acyl-carrier-protein] synthase II
VCARAGEINGFAAQKYLGNRNLRPLNRIAQLTAAAAQLALDASGWTDAMRRDREVGLALGTMFCSVRTISEFDRRAITTSPTYASALDFANTVINAAAGQTAIWHNLRGLNSTIATGSTSGLQAVAYATDVIRKGVTSAVLAGGAEEICFESVYGFHRAGLLCESATSSTHCSVPFDARRNGFVPGEGAALLMLEDSEAAASRGARPLAEVRGHGSSYDYSRGRDTGRAIAAIVRAMRQALVDGGLKDDEVDCLSASANGSVAGDHHEAMAIAEVFGGGDKGPAVTAIKSMLGETLGAAGGLQVVSTVEAMRDGRVPPIRGLEQVEIESLRRFIHDGGRPISLRHALLNAVGIDGHCCSVALGAPAEEC